MVAFYSVDQVGGRVGAELGDGGTGGWQNWSWVMGSVGGWEELRRGSLLYADGVLFLRFNSILLGAAIIVKKYFH